MSHRYDFSLDTRCATHPSKGPVRFNLLEDSASADTDPTDCLSNVAVPAGRLTEDTGRMRFYALEPVQLPWWRRWCNALLRRPVVQPSISINHETGWAVVAGQPADPVVRVLFDRINYNLRSDGAYHHITNTWYM